MDTLKRYAHLVGLGLLILTVLALLLWPWRTSLALIPAGLGLLFLGLSAWANLKDLKGFRRKAFLFSSNLVFIILLVLAILVLVNVVFSRYHARFDFTEDKVHSLSPETIQILKSLNKDISLRCFFLEKSDSRFRMERLLERYTEVTKRIKVEFIDPDKNPQDAQKNQVSGNFTTTIFACGDKTDRTSSVKEEDITNSIIKVSRSGQKVIYFLTGHGEKKIDDSSEKGCSWIKTNLEKFAYQVKTLEYALPGRFPQDCALLLLAGPEIELSADEWTTVRDYLRKGGRALFLIDPGQVPGLVGHLTEFGVKLENDYIYDEMAAFIVGDEKWPLTASFESHPITERLRYAAFFPYARTVGPAEKKPEEVTVTVLAKSNKAPTAANPGAWSERDLNEKPVKFDKGKDKEGPVPMAVAATVKVKAEGQPATPPSGKPEPPAKAEAAREGRLAVFGDSDFATNRFYYYNNNPANGMLFLNAVNWLAEEADLISIPPRTASLHVMQLSEARKRAIVWVCLIFLPLVVLSLGLSIWNRRRSR
jgi:ABC-type uncharacterized transport system involved in gliding motility auxiliary subunit